MASEASARLGTPPDRLWIQKPGIYEDEEGRTWVTVVVRFSPSHREWARASNTQGSASQGSTYEPSITVHLWQMAVHTREPLFSGQMPFSQLPPVWQLYPGRKYRAADSSFWEIVDHGQASVWWFQVKATGGPLVTAVALSLLYPWPPRGSCLSSSCCSSLPSRRPECVWVDQYMSSHVGCRQNG
ncbi:T-cell leukemia/lymphoma protein 1B isoform X1 [Macaca mulatta]|nr:T-cell leukemia/lymphoma protein 1B isoform X1 [Macaca nemestrina]